jgi:hypothetical protein
MILEGVVVIMHLGVGIVGLLLSRIDLLEHRLPNCGTGSLAVGLGILAVVAGDSGRVQSALLAGAVSAGVFALAAAADRDSAEKPWRARSHCLWPLAGGRWCISRDCGKIWGNHLTQGFLAISLGICVCDGTPVCVPQCGKT